MHIERLQVSGGFLDRLDLRFTEGLNVLIGARGTGKTSVIELLRFCVGAGAFTERAQQQARQNAQSILGNGTVAITWRDGDRQFTTSRSARQEDQIPAYHPAVTVLAQNEIESVGIESTSRLRLLDRFAPSDHIQEEIDGLVPQLRAATAEIRAMLQEIRQVEERLFDLRGVQAQLEQASLEQRMLLESVQASVADQELLNRLQEEARRLSIRATVVDRARSGVGRYVQVLEQVRAQAPAVDGSGLDSDVAFLQDVRQSFATARELIAQASHQLSETAVMLESLRAVTRSLQLDLDEQSRPIRAKLEALQTGAGEVATRVDELKEKQGQQEALLNVLQDRRRRLRELQASRSETYSRIEELRSSRFTNRRNIASSLNDELGHSIRITVIESEQKDEYRASIAATLQGSGIHYNALAPLIADGLSPIEFVEAIEKSDSDLIAATASIPPDRASNIVSWLQQRNLEDIVSARIDDGVAYELRDKSEFKPMNTLSVGQRCTVVLMTLLAYHDDILIVDQPEDHLDNAYITETLVPALLSRTDGSQLIFATHNANIPVLGEADMVIHMESDGKRGFIRHSGRLDDLETVNAVTSVMEGGTEAFLKRAKFYNNILLSEQ